MTCTWKKESGAGKATGLPTVKRRKDSAGDKSWKDAPEK
jgi:hypothetical protein